MKLPVATGMAIAILYFVSRDVPTLVGTNNSTPRTHPDEYTYDSPSLASYLLYLHC